MPFTVKVIDSIVLDKRFSVRPVGTVRIPDATEHYYRLKESASKCPMCGAPPPLLFTTYKRALRMTCLQGCELQVPIDKFQLPGQQWRTFKRDRDASAVNEALNKLGKLYDIPFDREVGPNVEFTKPPYTWKASAVGSRQRQFLEKSHYT